MTAINIIRLAESVHLFTDTKGGIAGASAGQFVKCLPIPHLSAAVATRGDTAVLGTVHRTASQYANYAEFRAGITKEMKAYARLTPYGLERKALAGQWDAFFIGWGEHGPDAFGLFSHDLHGYPAFTAYEIPEMVFTPIVPDKELPDFEQTQGASSIGTAVLEAQRQQFPSLVGGHMIETWIDVEGIHTRSLKPFADIAFRPAPTRREVKLPAAFARYQTEGAR